MGWQNSLPTPRAPRTHCVTRLTRSSVSGSSGWRGTWTPVPAGSLRRGRRRRQRGAADMDLVPREEFEAVKAMAAKARSENEALAMRVAELEKRSAGGGPSLGTVGTKTA